jgi:hypothetical protein
MFTRDDYNGYFEQIASLERLMIYRLQETMPLIDDPAIKRPLQEVADDERQHYNFIRTIFDSILFEGDDDRRRFFRNHRLGKVKVKIPGDGVILEGYCLDVSEGGLCIELEQKIAHKGAVEVWADFFDAAAPFHGFGEMAWGVEINPKLSMGKIRFKAGIRLTDQANMAG